jgi:asparagine synthase (glutamine-hydrolysing)
MVGPDVPQVARNISKTGDSSMSGICGMWEQGASWHPADLNSMLAPSTQPGDLQARASTSEGAAFAVSPRWDFQSIASVDNLLVVASADIFNAASFRAEVEEGFNRKIENSAELIARSYLLYGLGFVEKMHGSFSFALYDSSRRQVVLAVDHMGLEPVFWSVERGRLLFATKIAAIAAARNDVEVNPAAMVQFLLHSVVPAPLTIYKDVQRLQPGTMLIANSAGVNTRRYWDVSYKESSERSVKHWAENLRSGLHSAVHDTLAGRDAEHTGAYLSGGTDSSSVVAFASEKLDPVNTFSIYFENPRYDEISFARMAATKFGARHHEQCLQARDASDAIPKIVDYFDEPFANSSAIGSYHCARLAKEHGVDVLLAGDGGDELFGGNERYASDKHFAIYHQVPALLRNGLIKPVANLMPSSGPLSLPARYIRRAELPNPRRMYSYAFFLTEDANQIFDASLLEQVPQAQWLDIPTTHFRSAPDATSELNRLLYLDIKMTLADNDVRKVRGTAEMAGVHVRFPLMHPRLAELSGKIPAHLKLRGFEKRFIFKQAMRGILPDTILYKKKHGFGVPVGYWAMTDKNVQDIAAVLDEPRSRQRGYFQPAFLAKVRELNSTYPAYYGEVMWQLLVLELWHRRHYERRSSDVRAVGAAYAS